MDTANTMSAMSFSLLARDVYCVCFTLRDSLDIFHGEFAQARKKFFTGGKKAVRVGQKEIVKGFDGKLQGKLTRRSLYWKKTANRSMGTGGSKIVLEEAFGQRNGFLLVLRDFRGVITGRMFFDKNQVWIKSEYYEPRDLGNPRVIFKPCDSCDSIERFDYDREQKRYRSRMLYPVPYLPGAAEQSLLNAKFGEPQLILSTGEGDFCYCPEKEAEARKQALKEMEKGSIVLMPAWEVKNGSLSCEEQDDEATVTFTSLEEYARIEPPHPQDAAKPVEARVVRDETAPLRAGTALPAEGPAVSLEEDPEALKILAAAKKAEAALSTAETEALKTPDPVLEEEEFTGEDGEGALLSEESNVGYRGAIQEGRITGRGRAEQPDGLTAYDGEYRDGQREGFGSYYYKDGSLCYAGFWKEDKRDGLGVSFRNSDHALHVARWNQGEPEGFVTLFDTNGNLRFGGRIEEGKKQGVGVSYNIGDGTVFVGKWENGAPTGYGSAFDREGNLLYTGMWEDGKRNGSGTEFDENGEVVFSGEWKNGKYHNGILYKKLTKQELSEKGQAPEGL